MPKISALPPAGTLADDDETPFVDDSVGSTKKYTLSGLKAYFQALVGWIATAMYADGSVTAVKLATPPSRFVALAPSVQVVSADPANANFVGVDVTAQTSATAYAVLLTMSMSSGGAGNYTGQVRQTGSADAIIVVTNPSHVGPWMGSAAVKLDASQSFDYAASNAAVTNITIRLLGYWETVA